MLVFIDILIAFFKVFFSLVIAFYILYFFISNKNRLINKREYDIPILVSMAMVISFYIYKVDIPGYAELEKSCKNKRVKKLGEPVYVEGYYSDRLYCAECWLGEIVDNGASFMEVKIDDIEKKRGYPSSGIWRMEKKLAGSKDCSPFLEKAIINKKKRKLLNNKYCISAELVSTPKSKYGYYFDITKIVMKNKYRSTFSIIEERIVDMKSNEIISEKIDFKLLPYRGDGFHYAFSLDCGDVLDLDDVNIKNISFSEDFKNTLIIKKDY